MATKFKGYLLRNTAVGKFPRGFIKSYSATPNQQSDKNTYTDENGLLHRDVLSHTSTKIELETIPLHLKDKIEFQKYFPERTLVELEYWNDQTNDYEIGTFYVPSIEFSYYMITETDIFYNPIRVAFIEY